MKTLREIIFLIMSSMSQITSEGDKNISSYKEGGHVLRGEVEDVRPVLGDICL